MAQEEPKEVSRLERALNPQTPPEELIKLSKIKDLSVLRGVAQNPNSPLEALRVAGAYCPEELSQNLAISLLQLEDPLSIRGLAWHLREALSTLEEIPPWAWEGLTSGVIRAYTEEKKYEAIDYYQGLLQKKDVPPSVVEALVCSEDAYARCAVVSYPSLTAAQVETLFKGPDHFPKTRLFENPSVSLEQLHRMLAQDPLLNLYALSWPLATEEMLAALLSQMPKSRRREAAKLPHSERVFRVMAERFVSLRVLVADNPSAPLSITQSLRESSDALVSKLAKARDPESSTAVLLSLAEDKDSKVRAWVAKHPKASLSFLQHFAKDPALHEALVQNPNTPPALLREIVESPPGLTPEASRAFARHPNAPGDLLLLFLQTMPALLPVIAAHPNLPDSRKEALVSDREPKIRAAVAKNPTLSARLLERLRQDLDPGVRRAAMRPK